MQWIPLGACVVFVLGLLVGEARGHLPTQAVAKTSASLCFLAFAVLSGALGAGAPGVAVVVGLCLSVVGDVCLLSERRSVFLAGLVSFLLGHVAYVVGFSLLGLGAVGLALAAVVLGPMAGVVWRWLRGPAGDMACAVLAYIAVISVMAASAAGAAWADPSPARLGMLAASAAFFLSDLAVARERFVRADVRNRFVGLPLYYAAQLALGGLVAGA